MAHYVEVNEHYTERKRAAWVVGSSREPGSFISGRVFGPYTAAGAERVARATLANVADEVTTYPASGYRYAHYLESGTRVVKVHAHIPAGWRESSVTRNMPRGY
jgi:hypothetical protein